MRAGFLRLRGTTITNYRCPFLREERSESEINKSNGSQNHVGQLLYFIDMIKANLPWGLLVAEVD